LVRKLVAMGLCPRDIGVISPYVGQVMLVSDCLADAYPDVAVSSEYSPIS
jgi:superfamily I DNA and/or RNA helicase